MSANEQGKRATPSARSHRRGDDDRTPADRGRRRARRPGADHEFPRVRRPGAHGPRRRRAPARRARSGCRRGSAAPRPDRPGFARERSGRGLGTPAGRPRARGHPHHAHATSCGWTRTSRRSTTRRREDPDLAWVAQRRRPHAPEPDGVRRRHQDGLHHQLHVERPPCAWSNALVTELGDPAHGGERPVTNAFPTAGRRWPPRPEALLPRRGARRLSRCLPHRALAPGRSTARSISKRWPPPAPTSARDDELERTAPCPAGRRALRGRAHHDDDGQELPADPGFLDPAHLREGRGSDQARVPTPRSGDGSAATATQAGLAFWLFLTRDWVGLALRSNDPAPDTSEGPGMAARREASRPRVAPAR